MEIPKQKSRFYIDISLLSEQKQKKKITRAQEEEEL